MDLYLYDAVGNTFLVSRQKRSPSERKKWMDYFNVDGFIEYQNNPLKMRIFNKDGSPALMCGNGLRCFLHYGMEKGDLNIGSYVVDTLDGPIDCRILERFPFHSEIYLKPKKRMFINKKMISVDGILIPVYTLFLGTLSHIIIDYNISLNKERMIKRIQDEFKKTVGNISFVHPLNSEEFEILTYERGVGYTLSCGTANGAAYYLLKTKNLISSSAIGKNKGGNLYLKSFENGVLLSGDVTLKGRYEG